MAVRRKKRARVRRKYQGGGQILGSTLSGAAAGATIGSTVPGIGTAIGAGVGLIGGLLGNRQQNKLEEEQLEEQKKLQKSVARSNILDNTRSTLATFPTSGLEGSISFRNGGRLPNGMNIQDGGGVQQLSNDMFLFKGNNHENGGIGIDSNADSIVDAEVEGEEVFDQEGNRIYSDTLKPSEGIVKQLTSELGLSFGKNPTYAAISEKIGKRESKIEEKEDDRFSKNTREETLKRTEKALDLLFQDQELSKQPKIEEVSNFANGGTLNDPKYIHDSDQEGIQNFLDKGYSLSDINPAISGAKNFISVTTGEKDSIAGNNFLLPPPTSIKNNLSEGIDYIPDDYAGATSPIKRSFRNGGVIKYQEGGQAANLGSFLLNRGSINRLNTDFRPVLQNAPSFSFKDTSNLEISENQLRTQEAINELRRSGAQNTSGSIAELKAREIAESNRIRARSGATETAAAQQHRDLVSRISGRNANAAQLAFDKRRSAENEQLAARISNRNALVEGVVGNIAVNQANQLERDKLLMATWGDNRGTVKRKWRDNPGLAKRMGVREQSYAIDPINNQNRISDFPSLTSPLKRELDLNLPPSITDNNVGDAPDLSFLRPKLKFRKGGMLMMERKPIVRKKKKTVRKKTTRKKI